MDMEMEFGEVEQDAPQPHLRPDRNKHYAVVPCGSPADEDLPIYVDVDVLLDMESHALSDTTVELGGVLLGGQYHDQDGRPFVIVTDSLRAEHYQSTKGSFKFTHDTWSAITRQRDEFPAELKMVGWYHTHPDWGVFLSGMDMFICDNFFNKPLDVALVIDPCRGERGWFQWTGDARHRVRRTGGFHLIASRFRREELEWVACQLEGNDSMPVDPRLRSSGGFLSPPAPVVNIAESRSSWQPLAVLGMLTMQFLFLALIAWRLLTPVAGPVDVAVRQTDDERRMLDRIIGKLEVAPGGLVTELQEQQRANDQLQAANLGLHAQIVQLRDDRDRSLRRQQELSQQLAVLGEDLRALQEGTRQQRQLIVELEKRLETGATAEPKTNWTLVIASLVLVGLLAAGLAIVLSMRSSGRADGEAGELAGDFDRETDSEPGPDHPEVGKQDRLPPGE